MRILRMCGLIAAGGLLTACQTQQHAPREGAYVDLVMELMVQSARLSDGPRDAGPAVRAVRNQRGEGEEGEAATDG